MYEYKQNEQQPNIAKPYTEIAAVLIERWGMNVKNKNNNLHAYNDKVRMIVSFNKHIKGLYRWRVEVAAAGAFNGFGKNTSTDVWFRSEQEVVKYLEDETNAHKIYMDAFSKLSGKASALMRQTNQLKKSLRNVEKR